MNELTNDCLTISLFGNPDSSYIFNGISRNEYQAVFNTARFLNQQKFGLRLKELEDDTHMKRLFKPVAVFNLEGVEGKDEFIAIAEGVDVPLYIFTYQVEMV